MIDTKALETADVAILITGKSLPIGLDCRVQFDGDKEDIAIAAASVIDALDKLGLLPIFHEYINSGVRSVEVESLGLSPKEPEIKS